MKENINETTKLKESIDEQKIPSKIHLKMMNSLKKLQMKQHPNYTTSPNIVLS